MNTVKDADAGALFLRRMLHMNPAYGQYLASDEDLAGIVQLFAKRFRAKILASENPIQPATLYEPLCEVIWRVVGHVLHTIIDLQDNDNLPVPKEATGQVKMLLQTNVELSRKLNEMRRAYLRELSMHRDKQRRISEKAELALRKLQEEPVMFYEPLAYVLDEQTKAFVREVVEEKIKLEQISLGSREMESMEDGRHDAEEIEHQLKNAQAEMRVLRSAAARDAEAAKRARDLEQQARDELEKERKASQTRQEEHEKMEALVQQLRSESAQLKQRLISEQGKSGTPIDVEPVILEDPQVGDLKAQLEKAQAEAKSHQERIDQLYQDLRTQEQELEETKERLQELESSKKTEEKVVTVKTPVQDGSAAKLSEEIKAQAEKHTKIEKELRAANRALEKALEEEKAKNVPSSRTEAAVIRPEKSEPDSKKAAKVREPKVNVDEAVEKAVKTVTDQFEKKMKQQDKEIERLKAELEEALAKANGLKSALENAKQDAAKEKPAKQAPVVEEIVVKKKKSSKGTNEADEELQEKIEELEDENANLKKQISILHAKLTEVGGKEAVAEVMERIKLTVPVTRKKRKKKAFERLYEDAQRRIIELRMKEQKVREVEQRELMEAAKKVKDRKNAHQVEMLGHLQKAAEATRARFHDALANYHDRNQSPRPAAAEGGEAQAAEGGEAQAEGGEGEAAAEAEAEAEGERDRSESPVPSRSPAGGRSAGGSPGGSSPTHRLQEGKWLWDEDPDVVLNRLVQLRDENKTLQAEIQRLKMQQTAPEPKMQQTAPESFGLLSRPIMGRRELVSQSSAPSLGNQGAAPTRGGNQSPTAVTRGRNQSSSPPPPQQHHLQQQPHQQQLQQQPHQQQNNLQQQGPRADDRLGRPGPTFGQLTKSRSQPFSTPSSTPHAGAPRAAAVHPGNLFAAPSLGTPSMANMVGQVHPSQSPSPDLTLGFGSNVSSSPTEHAVGALGSNLSPAGSLHNSAPWAQRTPPAQLAGSMPLLGGNEPPWRRSGTPSEKAMASSAPGGAAADPLAPAPPTGLNGASINPVPPGQASKGPGPEWAPNVPGRVPATINPLEPIRAVAGSRSPRNSSGEFHAERQAPEDDGRESRATQWRLSGALPSATSLLPSGDGLAVGLNEGARILVAPPSDSAHARGAAKVSKSRKGSSASYVDEPKPMNGFCVTPLRSQEALLSLNGGNTKWPSSQAR